MAFAITHATDPACQHMRLIPLTQVALHIVS